MAQNTFHHFSKLPYELRIQIWALAIPCQFLKTASSYSEGRGCIRLYSLKHVPTTRSFQHARTYPALFAVNREARHKTARIDGGDWLPLNLSAPGVRAYTLGTPRVYVNLDKESVLLYGVYAGEEVVRVWGVCWAKPCWNFGHGETLHCVVRQK